MADPDEMTADPEGRPMTADRTTADPVIEFYGQKLTLTHFSGVTEDGRRITVQPTGDPLRFTTEEEPDDLRR